MHRHRCVEGVNDLKIKEKNLSILIRIFPGKDRSIYTDTDDELLIRTDTDAGNNAAVSFANMSRHAVIVIP